MSGEKSRAAIQRYLAALNVPFLTGVATEHSYRGALQDLLAELLPGIVVVNEPRRIECGAPDYILQDRKTGLNVAFVEAKDIGDADLDGRREHREQFDRYKASLDSLCFTDYLDFHFYQGADFIDSVRLAEPKGGRLVTCGEDAAERFAALLADFASVRPQRITSPSRLASLMAGKARLLAAGVRRYLMDGANADSMLAQQMEAFRRVLIHDIDADSFADVFAQTVTYGMFAARLHDATPEDFSRVEAATLIPKTNPLLRQMFQYIAMDTDESIEWIVDDLVALFAAVDVEKLMRNYGKDTAQTDPLLHFYEDFLAAYDPKLRKARGVWYTPKPVVDFIVRMVDSILVRDFGLPGGLADPAKTTVKVVNDAKVKNRDRKFVEREVHRVQILDPAAGTGTFLAETVRYIHAKVIAAMGAGAWQGYVAENLLPRLNGFEILMASYAMAHLKLDLLLSETGYEHRANERLRVFLTNSLEPYDKETGTLFAAALSQEANEANFVKRDCPVMVVMGNPPYSGESQNKGEWIGELMEDYKKEPGGREKLNERNPKWLNDDYVKFLRYGQYYIEKNSEGVMAYICPHGYLDNPTFRGMRWNLLKSFDDIYVLNLHGNAKKKEVCPDGSKDENVFDIMQGVSINIFVKRGDAPVSMKPPRKDLATVHYADLYGVREDKYAFLDANSIDSVQWQTLEVQDPYYFFVPKDFGLQEEYEKGFSLAELSTVNSVGVVTAKDDVLVNTSRDDLLRNVAAEYGCVPDERFVQKFRHRVFDEKFIYYDTTKVARSREKVMSHFFGKENLSLVVKKGFPREDAAPIGVSNSMSDFRYWSCSGMQGGDYVFPLYLYDDAASVGSAPRADRGGRGATALPGLATGSETQADRRPNFDAVIYEKICAAVRMDAADDFAARLNAGELGRNWFDIVNPAIIMEMPTVDIGRPQQLADRKAVKAAFKGFGVIENAADGSRVVFPAASAGKMLYQSGTDIHGIASAFKMLFESSLRAWNEREVPMEGHKFHFNVGAYRNYVNRFSFDGVEYFVRFTIREIGVNSSVHASTISEVALYRKTEGVGSDSHPENPEDGRTTPFIDNKIAFYFAAVNGVENGEVVRGKSEGAVEPEDVFNYIYGVLHTPGYREKYREFLKIDFPRIPYPKNGEEFRRIAAVGAKLVAVHLLKDESVTSPFLNPYARFEGTGDGMVSEVKVAGEGELRKVCINKSQWFDNVPEAAWNFYIGGYQPAQKWLKDRKGRILTNEDQQHYRAIVAALMRTGELMKELS